MGVIYLSSGNVCWGFSGRLVRIFVLGILAIYFKLCVWTGAPAFCVVIYLNWVYLGNLLCLWS